MFCIFKLNINVYVMMMHKVFIFDNEILICYNFKICDLYESVYSESAVF
jgi:hypothetical protein